MVKKLQKMADKKAANPSGLLDNQVAAKVRDSAQQIWLAGMGAFSKAQAEGGKVFEALMKEGTALQRKTQGLAEAAFLSAIFCSFLTMMLSFVVAGGKCEGQL